MQFIMISEHFLNKFPKTWPIP